MKGLFEGITYPAIVNLIAQWYPETENTRYLGFIWSGRYLVMCLLNSIVTLALLLPWFEFSDANAIASNSANHFTIWMGVCILWIWCFWISVVWCVDSIWCKCSSWYVQSVLY